VPHGAIAATTADLADAYDAARGKPRCHATAQAVLCEGEDIVVLCTRIADGGRESTFLVRLSAAGDELWRHDRPEDAGAARAFAAMPAGGYVMVGEIATGSLRFAGRIDRLDRDGELVDGRTVGGDAQSALSSVAVLASGEVIAGGVRDDAGWLVANDGEATLSEVAEVVAVAARPGGGFAIAGVRDASTTSPGHAYLAAFDELGGDVRWSCSPPEAGRGHPAALAAAPDGGVVAVGHRATGSGVRMWAARVHAAGAPAWERLLGDPDDTWRARAVAPLAGGDVAIAGDRRLGERRVVALWRLDAGGAIVWERMHPADDETARGVAATADGGLVLAGSAAPTPVAVRRALVRRLDSGGAELWARTLS